MKSSAKLIRFSGPLVLIVIAVALWLSGEPAQNMFATTRTGIENGEWWRFLTGNFLHTNTNHLLLNLAGFGLICALHYRYYRVISFFASVLVLSLGTTFGVYLFAAELSWYVGLSGMLHGLCVWGGWQDIRHGLKSGWLLLAGVLLKVTYEQYSGADAMVADLIDARVAIDAHLFGALSGFILVFANEGFQRTYKKRP